MTQRHGCNDKPRPAAKTILVQDGYYPSTLTMRRLPRYIEVPNVFDASVCVKGTHEPDSGCAGCQHARTAIPSPQA